jgi:serine/threonine protein kinase
MDRDPPALNLTRFVADLLASGAPIIPNEDVQCQKHLATGNTFTVYSGYFKSKLVAVKYFNFTAPHDIFSTTSLEVVGETVRENLTNASHEIRIMTNNILRRCPSIATLEGVFFETDDPAWIRPAIVMELAYESAPTLTDLLQQPLTPLEQRSLVNNVFDGLYALHSIKMCHGDVKPDNVLIFLSSRHPYISYEARISDFGFAFAHGQIPRGTGTDGWNAPECHSDQSEPLYREKANGRDVFSAALLMEAVFNSPITPRPSSLHEQVRCRLRGSCIELDLTNPRTPLIAT